MNLTFREAMLTFKRAPLLSALSVTTIAFSLFVLGLFGLVVVNLQDALRGVEERVEVVAYLLPGAPVEAVAQALKDIEAFPEVQSAMYVSEDDALARARAELVELRDVMQELERNPLPASIEVKLKPGFRDTDHVSAVAERLRGFGFVDDVRFGRDWVEKLDRLRGLAAAVGIVVGAAFAVVAIIIIGTTIRMAVLQRSREIAIMRLVGATDGFVRRPGPSAVRSAAPRQPAPTRRHPPRAHAGRTGARTAADGGPFALGRAREHRATEGNHQSHRERARPADQ